MRDRLAKEVAALMFKEKCMDRVGSHSFRIIMNSPAGMKSSRPNHLFEVLQDPRELESATASGEEENKGNYLKKEGVHKPNLEILSRNKKTRSLQTKSLI